MSRKTKTRTLFRLIFVLALVVGGTLLMSLSLPPSKAASIYTVNSLLDTDDGACNAANCTLREAINASNLDPGSTINFSVTGTVILGSALPAIEQTVTINGPGPSQLSISGNNSVRVFYVKSGFVTTFNGLTISNGKTGNFDSGGGIFIESPSVVNISNSIITGNTAGGGGGIGLPFTLTTFSQVNITSSTISGNSASQLGGGIDNPTSEFTITNSTISGNSSGNIGGGISSNGTVTISNSTISGNSSPSVGGGIFTGASLLTMKNCTVTGNSSSTAGGGVAADFGQTSNSTITGNSAPVGSGVYVALLLMPTLTSNIIALNSGGGNDVSSNTLVTSGGYNVIGTSNGVTWTPTDQLGVTAAQLKLGPLGDNGGPTETMSLACGSVAIDKGLNASASANDQRGPGFARTFDDPNTPNAGGDGTDAGAFEVQAACPHPPTNKDQCKNNGWQTLSRADGTPFKNQGDCIQYVNTGK